MVATAGCTLRLFVFTRCTGCTLGLFVFTSNLIHFSCEHYLLPQKVCNILCQQLPHMHCQGRVTFNSQQPCSPLQYTSTTKDVLSFACRYQHSRCAHSCSWQEALSALSTAILHHVLWLMAACKLDVTATLKPCNGTHSNQLQLWRLVDPHLPSASHAGKVGSITLHTSWHGTQVHSCCVLAPENSWHLGAECDSASPSAHPTGCRRCWFNHAYNCAFCSYLSLMLQFVSVQQVITAACQQPAVATCARACMTECLCLNH